MQAADSWATDAHKTLNVPYDSGLAIVRDRSRLVATFGLRADYLVSGQEDPAERTPEMSRRARGFPVWAVLRSLGRSGVDDLVDRLARHARRVAAGMVQTPGLAVVNDVVFTQVLTVARTDRRTQQLGARILAEGTAALTPGTWRGRDVLRCSTSTWATTDDDIDRMLAAVRRLATVDGTGDRPVTDR